MQHENRARRALILCCHCLRNLAFYRAGWKHGHIRVARQFWVNANGNFLDTSVLEWCKLFVEKNGRHHWRTFVSDPDKFYSALLHELKVTDGEFTEYAKTFKQYRDRFVAHLDLDAIMHLPQLGKAYESVVLLYDYMIAHEEENNCFHDAPAGAAHFFNLYLDQAKGIYVA